VRVLTFSLVCLLCYLIDYQLFLLSLLVGGCLFVHFVFSYFRFYMLWCLHFRNKYRALIRFQTMMERF
jgi:hypothetical protein